MEKHLSKVYINITQRNKIHDVEQGKVFWKEQSGLFWLSQKEGQRSRQKDEVDAARAAQVSGCCTALSKSRRKLSERVALGF